MQTSAPQELTERPLQFHGSPVARALLRLAGWRLRFDGLPAAQGVLVIFPHTSSWDLLVGLCAKWAIGIPVTFWGKDTLFRVPLFGTWLRWLGGVPVNRHSPQGTVRGMVTRMRLARERGEFLWLALAPEGTRARREGWRSGFYRVAVDAGVPVALVVLDFKGRSVGVHACLRLCGDAAIDMAEIARHYAGVQGLRPALAAPIRLR